MKRLFLSLFWLLPLLANGANIDFRNLNTNHFTTNGYRVSLKSIPTNAPIADEVTNIVRYFVTNIISVHGATNGNIVYVDQRVGSDVLARRWHFFWPALTPLGGKNTATNGDTVVVRPGNYTGTNLLKNAVNWSFMPGATVTRTTVDAPVAIFDDTADGANSAITCVIDGYGMFTNANALTQVEDHFGMILFITNAASNVKFRCARISEAGSGSGAVPSISVWNCALVMVDCDEWLGSSLGGLNNCVYWERGELYTRFRKAVVDKAGDTGSYTFWAREPAGGATNNWYLDAELIENPVYTPIFMEASTINYKWWVQAKEIRGAPDGGLLNAALNLGTIEQKGGGRLYVEAMKVLTRQTGTTRIGPCVWVEGGELWLAAQKLSADQPTNQTASVPLFAHVQGGTVKLDVMHYENSGNTNGGNGFRITGGQLDINGGEAGIRNGIGIAHSGGITTAKNFRLVSTNNVPVGLTGSGFVVENSVFVGQSNCIYAAAARTAKIYGTLTSNTNEHSNVTISTGTLIVNGAVQ